MLGRTSPFIFHVIRPEIFLMNTNTSTASSNGRPPDMPARLWTNQRAGPVMKSADDKISLLSAFIPTVLRSEKQEMFVMQF
jgi:hypothetical protein